MARKEKDTAVRQDHRYACKMNGYLTPPGTPLLAEPTLFYDDDDDHNNGLRDVDGEDIFGKLNKTIMPDFDLYAALEKINNEADGEDDLFFEFAEDFQDLHRPMLKKDCMWGTAAQIRPTARANWNNHTATDFISSGSDTATTTNCSGNNSNEQYRCNIIVTTPQPLIFRSVSTTPINFDERVMFTPIQQTALSSLSSTLSSSSNVVIESEQKDIDSSFKVSPTCFLSNSISLLSPNETESEEEIDVVGVTEKPKNDAMTTTTATANYPLSGSSNSTKAVRRRAENRQNANISSSSSDTDDSSSGRGRSGNGSGPGRVSHNDLERKRRDELKRKFDTLRSVIPDLETNERAPKVLILKKATSFVPTLVQEEQSLLSEKDTLKRTNDLLMQKLLKLAKSN
eukprot:gene18018-19822_t